MRFALAPSLPVYGKSSRNAGASLRVNLARERIEDRAASRAQETEPRARGGKEPQRRLRDQSAEPAASHEKARDIVPRNILHRTRAHPYDLPFRRHDLERQNVLAQIPEAPVGAERLRAHDELGDRGIPRESIRFVRKIEPGVADCVGEGPELHAPARDREKIARRNFFNLAHPVMADERERLRCAGGRFDLADRRGNARKRDAIRGPERAFDDARPDPPALRRGRAARAEDLRRLHGGPRGKGKNGAGHLNPPAPTMRAAPVSGRARARPPGTAESR